MTKVGVLPSFWDRLQQCGTSQLRERSVSVREFELTVLRDVERVLNERRPVCQDLPDRLRATIVAYGLPELTSFDLSSLSGADALALAIQETIRNFEPRLENVSVAVSAQDGGFRIRADIHIEPAVDRLHFQAFLNPDASKLEIGQLNQPPHAS